VFSITEHVDEGAVVLVVHGSLDLANAPALLARGRRVLANSGRLTLDLADVDVLDAIGIGVLLGLRRAAVNSDGELGLVASSAAVDASLTSHGVAHLLTI